MFAARFQSSPVESLHRERSCSFGCGPSAWTALSQPDRTKYDFRMQFSATLTCPDCGFAERLPMPSNACTFFHACSGCGTVIRPKPGDCCVFCSYGDRRCPPKLWTA